MVHLLHAISYQYLALMFLVAVCCFYFKMPSGKHPNHASPKGLVDLSHLWNLGISGDYCCKIPFKHIGIW